MKRFLVDLHIHSLLSPCGDLEMSPSVIVERALAAGLDAIALCDHNTTLQTPEVERLGRERGLVVFSGIELTTREEVHCVALLPGRDATERLQQWVDANILKVPNYPARLGDQVWVDHREMISGEIPWYLNSPIDRSIEEVAAEVGRAGGLFVPAHIDRIANSLIGQLGFLPPWLHVDAVEYNHPERFAALHETHPTLKNRAAYTASDAHYPNLIGTNPSWLHAESCTFCELRMAFAGQGGRRIASRREEP